MSDTSYFEYRAKTSIQKKILDFFLFLLLIPVSVDFVHVAGGDKDVDIVDNLPLTLQYAQIVDPTITSTKYKIAADLLATSSTQSLAQLASKHGVSLSQLSEIALKDIEIEAKDSKVKFSDYFTEMSIQIERPGSVKIFATATSIPASSSVKFQVAEGITESIVAGWLSGDYVISILGIRKSGVTSINMPVTLDIDGDVTFSLIKKIK